MNNARQLPRQHHEHQHQKWLLFRLGNSLEHPPSQPILHNTPFPPTITNVTLLCSRERNIGQGWGWAISNIKFTLRISWKSPPPTKGYIYTASCCCRPLLNSRKPRPPVRHRPSFSSCPETCHLPVLCLSWAQNYSFHYLSCCNRLGRHTDRQPPSRRERKTGRSSPCWWWVFHWLMNTNLSLFHFVPCEQPLSPRFCVSHLFNVSTPYFLNRSSPPLTLFSTTMTESANMKLFKSSVNQFEIWITLIHNQMVLLFLRFVFAHDLDL